MIQKLLDKKVHLWTVAVLFPAALFGVIFIQPEKEEPSHNYAIRTEAIYELQNGDVLLGTLQGLYKFVHKDVKKVKGNFIYL